MLVTADMASVVWLVTVSEGDEVEPGQEILVLESMKMEIPVLSPMAGVVADLPVGEGDVIEAGDTLARIERRP